MPSLPVINGREAIRALERAGFVLDHIQGSHHILFQRQSERWVSVPLHGGRDLRTGMLRRIIRDAGLTVEEFIRLLK